MDREADEQAQELESESPSPLHERLAEFRSGGSDKPPRPAAEKPAADPDDPDAREEDEEPETPEGEEPEEAEEETEGEKPEDEEGEEKPEGEEEETEEAEGSSERPQAKTFAIDLPTPGAEKGGPQGAILRLEGLPQEYRDAIAGHVKRSQQLDGTLQQLAEARELETVATFYQQDPLNAMRLVSVEQPELAKDFVSGWMLQHPTEALAIISQHKLDSGDKEKLQLRGQLAERDMKESLGKAYQGLEGQRAIREFGSMCAGVVDDLVEPLGLAGDAISDFAEMAAARVKREMADRQTKHMSPYLTKTELLTLLQPLVQKFGGAAPNGRPAGKKALTPAEMKARNEKAGKYRQLQRSDGSRVVQPTGLKKTRLPRDMGERIKLLRAGKLG